MKTKDVFLIQRGKYEAREYWQDEIRPNGFIGKIQHATRYDTREEAEEAASIARKLTGGEVEVSPTRILKYYDGKGSDVCFCDPID